MIPHPGARHPLTDHEPLFPPSTPVSSDNYFVLFATLDPTNRAQILSTAASSFTDLNKAELCRMHTSILFLLFRSLLQLIEADLRSTLTPGTVTEENLVEAARTAAHLLLLQLTQNAANPETSTVINEEGRVVINEPPTTP